ncbi:unnamed protein product [Echinostoma caproni]|uniref:Transposase n=1 Tax=Echinostoma caproni TaxID=27848 RepID=A0A182ZZ91_9TREM|nr:unnamed protein product [Echinostoma caproni]
MEQIRPIYEREFVDYNPSDETMPLEDRKALSIVENATIMSDGHLEVPIPWKEQPRSHPNNYTIVIRRLHSLKSRL